MAGQLDPLVATRRLGLNLLERNDVNRRYAAYYEGHHRLAYASSKYKDAFGHLFAAFANNFCAAAVDVLASRIELAGFDSDNPETAAAAWEMLEDTGLSGSLATAFRQALVHGEAYLTANPEDGCVVVEDSRQMFVVRNPGNPAETLVALKLWVDYLRVAHAVLYEPDRITTLVSAEPIMGAQQNLPSTGIGNVLATAPTPAVIPWRIESEQDNPLGVVPVFTLPFLPDAGHRGRSMLAPLIPLQDAINKISNDMLVACEFAAYPQRVITGIEVPKNPETGVPLKSQELEAAMSRLWIFENEAARVAEFSPVQLSNYVDALRAFVGSFAFAAVLPPTYFAGPLSQHGLSNVSGDAVAALEAAHIARAEELQRLWSRPIADAVALALGTSDRLTVDWRPVMRPPIASTAAAAPSMQAVGVPKEIIFRELGMNPSEVADALALPEPVETPAGDDA